MSSKDQSFVISRRMSGGGRGPGPLPPRWLKCPRKSGTLIGNRSVTVSVMSVNENLSGLDWPSKPAATEFHHVQKPLET